MIWKCKWVEIGPIPVHLVQLCPLYILTWPARFGCRLILHWLVLYRSNDSNFSNASNDLFILFFFKYWKQMQLSTIQLIVTHRNERFIHLKLASKFSIRWLSSQVAPCRSCVQRMYCSAAAVYKHYLYEIYNGDTIRLSFILLVRDLQPT